MKSDARNAESEISIVKEKKEIISMSPSQALSVDTMDEILTNSLLSKTIGEICYCMEHAADIKTYVACRTIINAVSDLDIGLINIIIRRVDGGIPKADEIEDYANYFGQALEDVLEMPPSERFIMDLDKDYGIVALAKAVVMAAIQPAGHNISKRKDRQLAADMLFSRTGGLKNEPQKIQTNIEIRDADWALPEKGESDVSG